ncbi:hypothetical protein ALC53_01523 [Atta colombica]|uniref:Uncharacterized protein n=1 Tax=Atta colombica TaxID=520822 RepID=A0A195BVE7_9HYME|nr:hypothetical protein ALC53_01523 [Atta colombica]
MESDIWKGRNLFRRPIYDVSLIWRVDEMPAIVRQLRSR